MSRTRRSALLGLFAGLPALLDVRLCAYWFVLLFSGLATALASMRAAD